MGRAGLGLNDKCNSRAKYQWGTSMIRWIVLQQYIRFYTVFQSWVGLEYLAQSRSRLSKIDFSWNEILCILEKPQIPN
jgi:hypothetical protein